MIRALSAIADTPLPTHESQVRPLKNLAPESAQSVWQEAIRIARGVPSARQVEQAKRIVLSEGRDSGVSNQNRMTKRKTARPAKSKQSLAVAPGLANIDEDITGRDRQILEMIELGIDDKSIADRLSISYHTVRTHLRRVFQRWKIHNRTEAAARFRNAFPKA